MKAIPVLLPLLLLPLLLLTGCASSGQLATGPVIPCPEVYNGCYAD